MHFIMSPIKKRNKHGVFLCFFIHSLAFTYSGKAMDLWDYLPSFSHEQPHSLLLKKTSALSQKLSSPRALSQEDLGKKLKQITTVLSHFSDSLQTLNKKDIRRLLALYKNYYQKLEAPNPVIVVPHFLEKQYEIIFGWNHMDITIDPHSWSSEDLEKVFNNPLIADKTNKGSLQELSLVVEQSQFMPSWSESYNEKLVNFFKNPNSSVIDFYLSSASLTKPDMERLTYGLSINTQITHLSLPSNTIGDEGAISLGAYLKNNKTLQHLNLSDNRIGDKGLMAITEGLKHNRTLKTLILGHKATTTPNSFTGESLKTLSDVLKDNHSLECLYLNYILINTEGAKQLSALIQNSTLRKISLSHCAIGSEGAIEIAAGLSKNKSLRYLSLTGNQIDPRGGSAIGKALLNQTEPLAIKLKGNYLGDRGAIQISEVLKSQAMIWKLDLSDNNIGDSGAKALLEGASRGQKDINYFYLNLRENNEIDVEAKKYCQQLATKLATKQATKKFIPCLFWVDF